MATPGFDIKTEKTQLSRFGEKAMHRVNPVPGPVVANRGRLSGERLMRMDADGLTRNTSCPASGARSSRNAEWVLGPKYVDSTNSGTGQARTAFVQLVNSNYIPNFCI